MVKLMRMNSRAKGKRGERQWRDELRANGYGARRGQQFAGSPESPDVVCDQLPWVHFEVKAVERLNIEDAMDQARCDCGRAIPIVAHKRNGRRWLVTIDADVLFRFLRGDLPPALAPSPCAIEGASGPHPPQSSTLSRGTGEGDNFGCTGACPDESKQQTNNERKGSV
jgi:hypothetical protein